MEPKIPTPKKPYQAPVLKVYGDIRDITKVRVSGPKYDNNSMRAKTT